MAVHLVRHAKAGVRRQWVGPDDQRPLTKPGLRQADALVALLGDRPVSRILSSPYLRCVQSVTPLADHLGIEIEPDSRLAEGARLTDAFCLVEDLLAQGVEAVLCSHGDVIPEVLVRLEGRGVELVSDEWSVKKGSTWTIEADAEGDITRAVHHPPPS